MTKKIFAISTLLLVLVVGAIFVYNFIFKKPSQNTKVNSAKTSDEGKLAQTTTTVGGSAAKNESAKETSLNSLIQAISDEPVFGAALSGNEEYIYYFLSGNGQLNQVDFSGKLDKVLSTEQYDNLKKVIWNKQKTMAIIKTETPDGKTKYLVYELPTKKVSVLKANIDSVSWSNMGDKIIYKYYDPKTKKRTVSIADPDGKNWKDISEFNYRGAEIASVPESSDVSFWPSPNALTPTSLNLVSFSGENKREILKDRFGADFLWSPDGKMAAVSYSDQKGGRKTDLALFSPQGGELQSLGFPTFASKCVWSNDSKYLFCALPGNIPESVVLPNDWQEGKITTADTFWKIDVSTGKKERLVDAEKIAGSYDVLNPFLSQDEKTLFFVNKADGKLYKLTL